MDIIPAERIERWIFLVRGQKVMLDLNLAELYQVETRHLKRQVRRNIERFPNDFMFQLSRDEYNSLRCHIGTLERGQHSKYLPYAFTEHGIAMLSSVLRSERAVQVNISIIRTFIRLKTFLQTHNEIAEKLSELEKRIQTHDKEIHLIFEAIRRIMEPEAGAAKPIGFCTDE